MRLIVISPPQRKDFYYYITERLEKDHEIFLLWNYKKDNTSVEPYGNIKSLYWSDYATPHELINKIQPDKILFLEILDLWQIALIIACHHFKIPTFFAEHGIGNNINLVIRRFGEKPGVKERFGYYWNKLLTALPRVLKNRFFYLSAAKYLEKDELIKYLKLPFYFKKYTPLHALNQLKFKKRSPHFAILFNRNNIDPYLLYNDVPVENIFMEGVPFFDKYYLKEIIEEDHVVYIEHPNLEDKTLGWDNFFHEKVAKAVERLAVENNIRVIVKLHPRSNIANWLRYNLNTLIEIKQNEDITQEMLTAKMILGFSSTLINAMIACKKNIVLLGWHPKPQIYGDDFSKSGLCHISYSTDDLLTKYEEWKVNNLTLDNSEVFNKFLKEYNYPFDGMATERMINFILEKKVE